MSDLFWQSFFASIPATIGAFSTLLGIVYTIIKLNVVHEQVNSKMDRLLNVTAVSSKAEGVKQEKEKQAVADNDANYKR